MAFSGREELQPRKSMWEVHSIYDPLFSLISIYFFEILFLKIDFRLFLSLWLSSLPFFFLLTVVNELLFCVRLFIQTRCNSKLGGCVIAFDCYLRGYILVLSDGSLYEYVCMRWRENITFILTF